MIILFKINILTVVQETCEMKTPVCHQSEVYILKFLEELREQAENVGYPHHSPTFMKINLSSSLRQNPTFSLIGKTEYCLLESRLEEDENYGMFFPIDFQAWGTHF